MCESTLNSSLVIKSVPLVPRERLHFPAPTVPVQKCHFADLLMVLALVEVPEVIYLWDPAELTSEICRGSLLLLVIAVERPVQMVFLDKEPMMRFVDSKELMDCQWMVSSDRQHALK